MSINTKSLFSRFVKDESGATAIEYGLIVAFVSVLIVATLPSIRLSLQARYDTVNTELQTAPK